MMIDELKFAVSTLKGGKKEVVRIRKAMKTLITAIDNGNPTEAMGDELVEAVEDSGGIVKGAQRVTSTGMQDVTIYSSDIAQQNHQWALNIRKMLYDAVW